MLTLKIAIAMLNLSFFFDRVPPEVDSREEKEELSVLPQKCFVNLQNWAEVESSG
jgi:hypothetical protein